jgi:hypothetical protein
MVGFKLHADYKVGLAVYKVKIIITMLIKQIIILKC